MTTAGRLTDGRDQGRPVATDHPTGRNGAFGARPRGLLFDAAMLAANLALAGPLAGLVQSTRGVHPLFGVLLLLGVVLYAAGAGLKRVPLQARLTATPRPALPGGMYLVFLALFVMQWALFAACLSFGLEILGSALGSAGDRPWQKVAAPLVIMGGGLIPVILAVRAILPPRHPASPSPRLARRERWADLALYLACVVFMAFWDGVFAESLAEADVPHWLLRVLLAVLVTVPFAMFYLAPRAVFLAEDYRSKEPWLGALLVMAPLAWRLVFG